MNLDVCLANFEKKVTKTGKEYLLVTVLDSSTQHTFPIWDGWEGMTKFELGTVIRFSGAITQYDGKPQIKPQSVSRAPDQTVCSPPSYDVRESLAFLKRIISGMSSPWKELTIAGLGLKTREDGVWDRFISAPAAKVNHSNKVGGLLVHTVGVVRNVCMLCDRYEGDEHASTTGLINRDRLLFAAFLHDIGKINDYLWVPTVRWNPDTVVDHIHDSPAWVEYANRIAADPNPPLDYAEVQRVKYLILAHHGDYGEIKPKNIEHLILHWADMLDGRTHEAVEGKR